MKNILRSLILLLLFSTVAQAQNTKENTKGFKIGDEVPDFSLLNTDGIHINMGLYKDAKGFIVIFTCDHCPYAKAYQERIKALNLKYAPQGYMVLAINPNDPTENPSDSYDSMKVRYKSAHFNFPYLMDDQQKVASAFGATRTPHVFILQKQGLGQTTKYMVRYIGAIDDNYEDASKVKNKYVEDAVNSLLKHEYPAVENTKAIGCGIKWRKG